MQEGRAVCTLGLYFSYFSIMCLHVFIYSMCMSDACRDQKVSDPLRLGLQIVWSCHVSTKNQTQFSVRTANALDC